MQTTLSSFDERTLSLASALAASNLRRKIGGDSSFVKRSACRNESRGSFGCTVAGDMSVVR